MRFRVRWRNPEAEQLKLTDDQIQAATKRIADSLEKLSIGSALYWMFQEKTAGLVVGIIMMLLSLAITVRGAKK